MMFSSTTGTLELCSYFSYIAVLIRRGPHSFISSIIEIVEELALPIWIQLYPANGMIPIYRFSSPPLHKYTQSYFP